MRQIVGEMKNLIKKYLAEEPNESYRQEIMDLEKNNNTTELLKRLNGNWQFGTAGIRAKIGAGYTHFNSVSVSKIIYAFGLILKPESRISIGFDNRQYSRDYAHLAAQILKAQGHECLIFKNVIPTPVCAFSILKLKADAGIMITASHNPTQYNGIKIYNKNSIQIKYPQTKLIESKIKTAPNYLAIPKSNSTIKYIENFVYDSYISAITGFLKPSNYKKDFCIIYTPIHGTGTPFVTKTLNKVGFKNIHIVTPQAIPNGKFPTVEFPNPEEPSTLKLAIDLAKRINADLVLANDPDSDRLAVWIKNKVLTGNEIGILLANHLIETRAKSKKKLLVISTLVSSRMLSKIAKYHNIAYSETATGFANMAHEAFIREIDFNEKFLFGYEEALGYCVGNTVRDKDGIGAAVAFAQLFSKLYSENKTILEELDRLYLLHGLHVTDSWYLISSNSSKDILTEVDLVINKNSSVLKLIKRRSEIKGLLTYSGNNKLRLIIRKSGTEDKIKFYAEITSYPKSRIELKTQIDLLNRSLKQTKKLIINIINKEIESVYI